LRKILVTGGAGYIGDSVVEFLTNFSPNRDVRVEVLDDLIYGGSYMRDVFFIRTDITDYEAMEKIILDGKYDCIVHLAALVGDGACAVNPSRTKDVNLTATKIIAYLCKKTNTKLVFASTCSVYGANNDWLTEDSSTNPLSIYAETKLAAEEYIRDNLDNYVIFRLGTLFGMSTGHARVRCDLVANILTYRAAQGDVLEVHGGEQWRPLLHVRDAARGFALAALDDEPKSVFSRGTYILALRNCRISDLAKEIIETVGAGSIESTPRAFEDLRNYKVDMSKVKSTTYHPLITLKMGIQEMHEVLKDGRIADIWSPEFHNARYIASKYGKAKSN